MVLKHFGVKCAAGILMLLLSGCSDFDFPQASKTTGRSPTLAEVPEPDETVRGAENPPIVTLELGSEFQERTLTKTDPLPGSIIIPTTNLNSVPVTIALQAVLDGTDVSLSWESSSFDDRLVTVTNLSGSLPTVVDKICTAAKVFCSHRDGLLEIKDRETFVIELPSMITKATLGREKNNTMADVIGELAGEKVRVDSQGGNLIYTTDVVGQERIQRYIRELRNGRPLVVMQLYIWEVILDSDKATGINWEEFTLPNIDGVLENVALSGLTGFSSLDSPGVSLGATFSGKVDAKAVMQFLSTQGLVQTISNPQLTFVSGSNAEFRVGGTQHYISEVGTSSSDVSSSSSSSSSITTDTLDTGLKVSISGVYENGVVSAALELDIEDIVSLNPTITQGYTIDLPETTERKVQTSMRVRPGDNLVLAGLVSSRDEDDADGIPFWGKNIPSYRRDKIRNTEMVILVKPSVVLFSDKNSQEEERRKKNSAPYVPPLDAVLIDKDGSQFLKMPDTPEANYKGKPELNEAFESVYEPEVEVQEKEPLRLGDVPLAPSDDGAPVDRRLFQRGFSHAYDALLDTKEGVK